MKTVMRKVSQYQSMTLRNGHAVKNGLQTRLTIPKKVVIQFGIVGGMWMVWKIMRGVVTGSLYLRQTTEKPTATATPILILRNQVACEVYREYVDVFHITGAHGVKWSWD